MENLGRVSRGQLAFVSRSSEERSEDLTDSYRHEKLHLLLGHPVGAKSVKKLVERNA
jgi:hypothetical protein